MNLQQLLDLTTHKFISIGNYLKTGNYFDNGQRVVLNEKTSTKLLNENDLVMVLNDKTQAGDLIGSTILINESDKFIYNQRSERLVCKIQTVFPKFLWHLFNTQKFRKMVFSISQGGTQIYVNFPAVKKLNVSVPNIEEQQKIADFLSAVDEKITALAAQKTALTQYKQGMMQRIFSQTLRFKDDNGADYPDWEFVNFGDVFTFKSTNSYSRECLNYETGTTKNIHYGDIHTKFKTLFDITNEKVPFVNSDISLDKVNDEAFCRVGDLVIADASEDYKDIGKSIEIINLNNQRVIAGLHTFLARPATGLLSTGFIGYAMQSAAVRLQVMTVAQGTKVLSISAGRLAKVQIPLPKTEEQTKIAQFLTECDDKINAVDAQIQSAQQWKQGLLQQMFV